MPDLTDRLIARLCEAAMEVWHYWGGNDAHFLKMRAVPLEVAKRIIREECAKDAAPGGGRPAIDDVRAERYESDVAEQARHEMDAVRAERDTLRKQAESTYCAYCGHVTDCKDVERAKDEITEHIRTCPKHPMRAVEAELARLRTAPGLLEALKKNDVLGKLKAHMEDLRDASEESMGNGLEALAAAQQLGAAKNGKAIVELRAAIAAVEEEIGEKLER